MKFVAGLTCHLCGATYPPKASWVCSDCLGPLEVSYDYNAVRKAISRELIESRPRSLWRYVELLPVEEPRTGFYSGFTPLVRATRLADALGLDELYIKDDSVNHPTFSYKDRVVSVAATKAIEFGFPVFGCASTGNLAGSVAAHAARLGLECYVFIPHDLEPAKILGAAIYRPHVVAVDGNYDDVNRLCTQVADRYGWGFANINLRSYYAEGAKTMGFEIAEQLGWRYPDHIVSPVAGGTLLPRIFKGLREFSEVGLVSGRLPRIHAAQPSGSAPVVRALEAGLEFPEPVKPNTIAKSLAIGNPADGFQVVKVVKETGGSGAMVSDAEILDAIDLLAAYRRDFHGASRRHDAGCDTRAGEARRDQAERIGRGVHHGEWLQDHRGHGRSRRATAENRARPVGFRAGCGAAGSDCVRRRMYPVFLKLRGRRVLLVGGGRVAAAKLAGLLAEGANVTVVAPEIRPELRQPGVTIVARAFDPRDVEGVWYVVTAAPRDVNEEVVAAAEHRRVFVNAVDDPSHASAYAGSVVRRAGVTIAFSTDGRAPALAGLLREALDAWLPADLDTWMAAADEARRKWKRDGVPMEDRRPLLLETLNRLYERKDRSQPEGLEVGVNECP